MKHVYLVVLISGFLTALESQNNFGHVSLEDLLQEQVRCDMEFKKISPIALSQWPSFKKNYLKRHKFDVEIKTMDILCQLSLIQSILTRTSLMIYRGSNNPEKGRIIQELNKMQRKINKDKKNAEMCIAMFELLAKEEFIKVYRQ